MTTWDVLVHGQGSSLNASALLHDQGRRLSPNESMKVGDILDRAGSDHPELAHLRDWAQNHLTAPSATQATSAPSAAISNVNRIRDQKPVASGEHRYVDYVKDGTSEGDFVKNQIAQAMPETKGLGLSDAVSKYEAKNGLLVNGKTDGKAGPAVLRHLLATKPDASAPGRSGRDTIVLGDSIAQGVGGAMQGARVAAKVGINSGDYLHQFGVPPGRHGQAVISLGANDASGATAQPHLEALRNQLQADHVVWLLPNSDRPGVRDAIQAVARAHGDQILDTAPIAGRGLHPSARGYAEIAKEISAH
jgi:hypothetical protein